MELELLITVGMLGIAIVMGSFTVWMLNKKHTQAIMDLGATLCTRSNARCLTEPGACPVVTRCSAYAANQVDNYPERKPKKTKPERHARLWVLYTSDGRTLLQQRPSDGIWGPDSEEALYNWTLGGCPDAPKTRLN